MTKINYYEIKCQLPKLFILPIKIQAFSNKNNVLYLFSEIKEIIF